MGGYAVLLDTVEIAKYYHVLYGRLQISNMQHIEMSVK